MNTTTSLEWKTAVIADIHDIPRIQKKIHSQEGSFSSDCLQEDITNGQRILVLLEETPAQIAGIIELHNAGENYPGLYYSRTPPQWGRGIAYILPEILRENNLPCTEIAFPSSGDDDFLYLAPARGIYKERQLMTTTGDCIKMFVAKV